MRQVISGALLFWVGLAGTAQAELGAPAGIAGAVSGQVGLTSPAKQITSPVAVASGDGIVMGDNLATATESRLQVMLLDESAITLGPNAALTIDEFVFDPANTNQNALAASLLKGTFRLVTGGIARQNPEGTSVNLPNAVLTIRGTTVLGSCAQTCVVALAGSGEANSAAKKPSTITLKSAKGEVTLKRPGFYVEIAEDGTISEPERLTDAVEARFADLFPAMDAPAIRNASFTPEGILDASGQPTQDGRPLAINQRQFENVDQLDGNDLFETTSNLPIGQEIDYSGSFSFGGSSGDGDVYINYNLNLAARDFSGTALIDHTDAGFQSVFSLTGSPFQAGAIAQSGQVAGGTINDTYSIVYSFDPRFIFVQDFRYDQDGAGITTVGDSDGIGLIPAVP